jgi:ferredoxin-type protein NapH
MKVSRLRFGVQIVSFGMLTYGGSFGLRLGHFLPCFSCPYVHGCAGNCYIMALQNSTWGFELAFEQYIGVWGLRVFLTLLGFVALAMVLGKTWCGWVCPFGTLQDWVAACRKSFRVRESHFSWNLRNSLKPVKYFLLVLLIIIPVLIANAGLHEDFKLPFCQICPAKPVMPLFEANTENLAVDFSNAVTTAMSLIALTLAGSILAGMVFKDRFFCLFCPMLALLSLFDRIGFMKLKKRVDSCTGCGACQRVCPMAIREVHLEKEREDVLTQDCMLCLKCTEACPQDNTLAVTFLRETLFSSSGRYVSTHYKKDHET